MDHLQWIDQNKETLIQAANDVWGYAETLYQEKQSAALLSQMLEEYGFKVTRGVAEIPTAFVAEYGAGGPVIGILGEYDALPGLSQDTVPYRKPLQEGAPGHGCGHNLFGVACLAAATAVKQAIETGDVKGTIRFYGCPAEEGGAAKTFMARAGLFDDADLCLTWHPGDTNAATAINALALIVVNFRFFGTTAHAAADPYNGRSALDAVELMNVGVNYLREHVIPDARIHYVIKSGGMAANVVPGFAESQYFVRSPLNSQAQELFERVKDIARGAALMTGTKVEWEVKTAMSNLLLNETIIDVMQEKLQQVGAPKFDDAEQAFAKEVAATFPAGSVGGTLKMAGPEGRAVLENMKGAALAEAVLPVYKSDIIAPGSTDVGDVTWVSPTGQITTTCWALGTPGHSWQITAQDGMSIGHKGMLYAGKVLGATALEFMQKPELVAQARAEFKAQTDETPYMCPIPSDVKPPLNG
jgi:aminobenzoyl-glutamate utilization protein B